MRRYVSLIKINPSDMTLEINSVWLYKNLNIKIFYRELFQLI